MVGIAGQQGVQRLGRLHVLAQLVVPDLDGLALRVGVEGVDERLLALDDVGLVELVGHVLAAVVGRDVHHDRGVTVAGIVRHGQVGADLADAVPTAGGQRAEQDKRDEQREQ